LERYWEARLGAPLCTPRSDVDICGHHFDDSFITLFKQRVCVLTTQSTDGNPKAQARRLWYVNCPSRERKNKQLSSISNSPQLINKDTNATVAQSHSRIRGNIFKKPRDMSPEISEAISHAVDVVLLTFILVRKERESQRSPGTEIGNYTQIDPISLG